MREDNQIIEDCRELLASGAELDKVIHILRTRGFSKIQTIKALVDLRQATMSQAKIIVHESPTWADVRERDEEFQSKL